MIKYYLFIHKKTIHLSLIIPM